MLFQGIDTVLFRVSDITAATDWYTRHLGLSVTWQDESLRLCVLDTGCAVPLTLWQAEGPIVHRSGSCFPIFKTADAAAARAQLVHAGVRADALETGNGVVSFRFYDEDGNMMEGCEVTAS